MSSQSRIPHPRAPRWWRAAAGQSLAETVIALALLMMIVLGLVHLSLLASTKHLVNYAAFAGARALMYGPGASGPMDRLAVQGVTSMMNWGHPAQGDETRLGYKVAYPTPFAYPLFNDAPGNIVTITSVAPIARQQNIAEEGDNASR